MRDKLPTEDEIDVVVILNIILSSLSLLGNIAVIMSFVAFDKVRTPGNRIIFYLTIANLGYNVSNGFGFPAKEVFSPEDKSKEQPIEFENNIMCRLQGYIMTYGVTSTVLWNLCIARLIYGQRKSAIKDHDLLKSQIESRYLTFAIVGPFVYATFSFLFGTYGPTAFWCWFDATDGMKNGIVYPLNFIIEILTYCLVWISLPIVVLNLVLRRKGLPEGGTISNKLKWHNIVFCCLYTIPAIHMFILLVSTPNSYTFSIIYVLCLSSYGIIICILYSLDPKVWVSLKELFGIWALTEKDQRFTAVEGGRTERIDSQIT